jgi:hypothetical protein
VVSLISRIPVAGKSTIGNREVTAMGTGSEIHQIAIHKVMPNMIKALSDISTGG